MASTRSALQRFEHHLDESMGVRTGDANTPDASGTKLQRPAPQLSPVPSPKDIGRRPIRNVGTLPVNQVIPDPQQPRVEFTADAIERLAGSIREKGQLSPIRVRWSDSDNHWIIISGERRWRAARTAGLSTIECYFHESQLSPSEILEQQLIENLLREDLQPIEEAKAFADLMGLNGWNGKQLSAALHIAPAKVSRALALLKLPDDIQRRVDMGEISARAGYEISKLDSDDVKRNVADHAANGHQNHAATARTVQQRRGRSKPKPRGTKLTFPLESGWTVAVSANRKGTYFEIEEALQAVLDEVRLRIENNVQIL